MQRTLGSGRHAAHGLSQQRGQIDSRLQSCVHCCLSLPCCEGPLQSLAFRATPGLSGGSLQHPQLTICLRPQFVLIILYLQVQRQYATSICQDVSWRTAPIKQRGRMYKVSAKWSRRQLQPAALTAVSACESLNRLQFSGDCCVACFASHWHSALSYVLALVSSLASLQQGQLTIYALVNRHSTKKTRHPWHPKPGRSRTR